MLLYTRQRILESDFSAEICSGLSRLEECLRESRVWVVVVCHSVPNQECQTAIEMARAAWPGVKILTLLGGHPGKRSLHCDNSRSLHSDNSMDSLEGPPALLCMVHCMLGNAPPDSRPEAILQ